MLGGHKLPYKVTNQSWKEYFWRAAFGGILATGELLSPSNSIVLVCKLASYNLDPNLLFIVFHNLHCSWKCLEALSSPKHIANEVSFFAKRLGGIILWSASPHTPGKILKSLLSRNLKLSPWKVGQQPESSWFAFPGTYTASQTRQESPGS